MGWYVQPSWPSGRRRRRMTTSAYGFGLSANMGIGLGGQCTATYRGVGIGLKIMGYINLAVGPCGEDVGNNFGPLTATVETCVQILWVGFCFIQHGVTLISAIPIDECFDTDDEPHWAAASVSAAELEAARQAMLASNPAAAAIMPRRRRTRRRRTRRRRDRRRRFWSRRRRRTGGGWR